MNATETVKALREWADKLEAANPPGEHIDVRIGVHFISTEAWLCEWIKLMDSPFAETGDEGTTWVKERHGDFSLTCFYSGFSLDPKAKKKTVEVVEYAGEPDLAAFVEKHCVEAPA